MDKISGQVMDKIERLSQRNVNVSSILNALRTNNLDDLPVIEVRQIVEATKLERSVVVSALRKMEAAGAGKFIVGRRGQESRFQWGEYRATSADRTADALQQSSAVRNEDVSSIQFEDYPFFVRPGIRIKIRLPVDLTREEAERLGEFVRSIGLTS